MRGRQGREMFKERGYFCSRYVVDKRFCLTLVVLLLHLFSLHRLDKRKETKDFFPWDFLVSWCGLVQVVGGFGFFFSLGNWSVSLGSVMCI